VNGRPTFTESHPLTLADTTGAGRPAAIIRFPATFNANPSRLRPLVIVASSMSVAVTTLEVNYGLTNLATTMDAIVLLVNGKTGGGSGRINEWNANLCCCWDVAEGTAPDDSGYLASRAAALIAAGWPIDPKRVYGIGQGGAGDSVMYRSACDYPDKWAAIVGINGSGTQSHEGGDAACSVNTSQPLAIAHLHGTADVSQERYTGLGGLNAGMFNQCKGTIDSGGLMEQLRDFNGCAGSATDRVVRPAEDLSADVGGSETDFLTFTGCPQGREVELWRATGEDHTFTPTANFVPRMVAFFNAHPKP
jgi:poly(3-hydroxybutyrate) depolymerase